MSLLVISNRVPEIGKPAGGGLAVLLADALTLGDTWLGWNGKLVDGQPGPTETVTNEKGVAYATFGYSRRPGERFYRPELKEGDKLDPTGTDITNGIVWRAHHGDRPDRVTPGLMVAYETINKSFAQRARELIRPDTEAVWVHDYHLMSTGKELRKLGVKKPIGFFLHIPFPGAEDRAQLTPGTPKKLYEGLLHYDLVGFQTRKDIEEFRAFAMAELDATRISGDALRYKGRTVKLGVYPAGIDPAFQLGLDYRQSAIAEADARNRERIEDGKKLGNIGVLAILDQVGDRKMLFSVERMDPSKGILERLTEFRDYLRENPDQAGKLVMVQIGTITRQGVPAYVQYRKDVLAVAEEINTEFGSKGRNPVIISQQTWGRDQLAYLAHHASGLLVTPKRDGMNLVAKEFVTAQDPRDPAALMIGKGAGAAEKLGPYAIVVDPQQKGSIKKGIAEVLASGGNWRINAYYGMMREITSDTAEAWGNRFKRDLLGQNGAIMPMHRPGRTGTTNRPSF